MAPPAHFNHAGASIPPPAVVERVISHLRLEAEIGGYEAGGVVVDEDAAVSVHLGALLGAAPADVLVVESATRAWEMIVWALAHSHGWTSSDRIVVDQFAYSSSWATLMRLRSVTGVDVVVAPALEDGSVDADRLDEVVDDHTRLVLATHIPTHLGTVTDVAAVGQQLVDRNLIYAVDASQSLGHRVVDVASIGCQVAFAPGRKFLHAPRGTGVLYVDSGLAETVVPLTVDLTSATDIGVDGYTPQAGTGRFELFEHSLALKLGLGEAARHALEVGPAEIERRVAQRTQQVVDLLDALPEARLVAQGPVSGIVSYLDARLDPYAARDALHARGINVWTNPASGSPIDADRRGLGASIRISPHYVTTDADLDALARALHSL